MRELAASTRVEGKVRDGFKRPLDLFILLSSHLLLLPLWVFLWMVIPIAIKLDGRGPVLYPRPAVGKNGRVFKKLKFRTMVWSPKDPGGTYTVSGDPRITRVGRLLRRTAMDELPQLINILKGDMSFVGPRAFGVDSHKLRKTQIPDWEYRVRALPGLTSSGRVYSSPDDDGGMLARDLGYINTMSPLLDIKLLFISLWIALKGGWDHKAKN